MPSPATPSSWTRTATAWPAKACRRRLPLVPLLLVPVAAFHLLLVLLLLFLLQVLFRVNAALAARPHGDDEVLSIGVVAHHQPLIDFADELLDVVLRVALGDAEGAVSDAGREVEVHPAHVVAVGLDDEGLGVRRPALALEVVLGHGVLLSLARRASLGAGLAAAQHHPLVGGDLLEAHRPP